MPHAPLTLFISVQCMAIFFFSFLPFCHCHVVASCPSSISWLCLMHATNACCHILLCWDSSVDPIHTCTYTTGSIKGCKCQPENSSLVLLVFPHQSHQTTPNPLLVPWIVALWSFSCLTIALVVSRLCNLVPLTVTLTVIVALLRIP